MMVHEAICKHVDMRFRRWLENPPENQDGELLPVFFLKSYGFEFAYPIDVDLTKLPSLTLTYGGFEDVPPNFVSAYSTVFTLTVYTVVKALKPEECRPDPKVPKQGRSLLEACADMHAAMGREQINFKTQGLEGEDGIVNDVKLVRGRSGQGKFTKYEFLQFSFDFYITEALPSVF